MFVVYRYREFAPQEYDKRSLIQVPEDDYQAYEPQVPAYQDPNQILFKRSKLQTLHIFTSRAAAWSVGRAKFFGAFGLNDF